MTQHAKHATPRGALARCAGRCEYAKSGRSKCKKCKTAIEQGTFRIAKLVFDSRYDAWSPNWYHPACFWEWKGSQKASSTDEFEFFDSCVAPPRAPVPRCPLVSVPWSLLRPAPRASLPRAALLPRHCRVVGACAKLPPLRGRRGSSHPSKAKSQKVDPAKTHTHTHTHTHIPTL